MSNDITNLSYRMSKQIDLAMNDLKNFKRNIKQINTIIKKDLKYNPERKIEHYEEKDQTPEEKEDDKDEENVPAAGFIGRQHNMTHNRWISSLRGPFGLSFY